MSDPETWLKYVLGAGALTAAGIFLKTVVEAGSRRFVKWLALVDSAATDAKKTRTSIRAMRREQRERDEQLHGRLNHAGFVGRVNSARLNHQEVRLGNMEKGARNAGWDLPHPPPLLIPTRDDDPTLRMTHDDEDPEAKG